MFAKIGILEAAYYLPPTRKPLGEVFRDEKQAEVPLAANVDFQRDIGIEAVHVAGEESASSVALKACRKVVDKAQIDPRDIDLIVSFTSIPEDYIAPTWSAAGYVQKELGATRAFATAINTGGCASYQQTLKSVCSLMSTNDRFNLALLFAGDKVPALNHNYYPITVVCDGGGAVLLKKNHDRNLILSVEVITAGKLHDVWWVPGFPHRDPEHPEDHSWMHVAGDINRFNTELIPINLLMFRKVIRGALQRAGKKSTDVKYYVYPTFSSWDQRAFCRAFSIPTEKVFTAGLQRHGHLQETDMVIDYVDARDEGHIHPGDLVMLTTNGAGFSWGAALVQH
jgi:3-oxoacyl-[acyl-carrier-protein] synthase III